MSRKEQLNKWKDFYNIPEDGQYIHSHWDTFERIYQINNLNNNNIFNDFFTKYKYVLVNILREYSAYSEDMRAGFIQEGVNQGVFTTTDPNQSLKEWNQLIQKIKSEYDLFRNVLFLKSFQQTITDFAKTSKKVYQDKKRYIEEVSNNLQQIIEALITIYNFATTENSKLLQFANGIEYKPYAKKVKAKDVHFDINRAFFAINQMVSNFQSSKTSGTDKTLQILEKIKKDFSKINDFNDPNQLEKIERFITTMTRQDPRKYIKDFLGGKTVFTDILGGLLEVGLEQGLKEQDGVYVDIAKELAIESNKSAAELLKDLNVQDISIFKFTFDNEKIIGGASLKATKPTVSKNYAISDIDFSKTPFFKKMLSGSGSSIELLHWLRANIISLHNYTADDNSETFVRKITYDKNTNKPKYSSNNYTEFIDKYLEMESDIAGISSIPRAFDGILEMQEEIKGRDFNGARFYNAVINIEDKFYWLYDILIKLIEELSTNFMTDAISYKAQQEKSKKSVYKTLGNPQKLEELWKKKINFIQSLRFPTYKKAISDSSIKTIISNIYDDLAYRSPIGNIGITIKYGRLI